jgi:hypothetical protein
MWLIRLNKLTTKEYNLVTRVLKKIGFFPRKISGIIYIKALLFHLLQKKSWRSISILLNCNYIILHNFYSKYKNSGEITKIFHAFAESRIIVYVGEKKTFTNEDLDNSLEFLKLTKTELNLIFDS